MDLKPLSSSLTSLICELIIVMTHTVLYERSVYPQGLFENVRHPLLHSMPLHLCRHPDITRYVHDTISDLEEPIMRGEIDRVAIAIRDEGTDDVVEGYMIDISSTVSRRGETDAYDAFRTMIVKFIYALQSADPFPRPCTFRILAYGKTPILQGHNDEWSKVDAKQAPYIDSAHAAMRAVSSVCVSSGRLQSMTEKLGKRHGSSSSGNLDHPNSHDPSSSSSGRREGGDSSAALQILCHEHTALKKALASQDTSSTK